MSLCGIFSCDCWPAEGCNAPRPRDKNPAPYDARYEIKLAEHREALKRDEEFANQILVEYARRLLALK